MKVDRYAPGHEKEWRIAADGARSAKLYTVWGIVEIFSFPGSDGQRAFTSLELFIHPHVYHATLPRHYHDRWLLRLANKFGGRCYRLSEGLSA